MDENPFQITFAYDYPEEFFFNNQTVCMSFDGRLENLAGQLWLERDCKTIYNINEDNMDESTLVCQCSSLKNYYQGIITDKSRNVVIETSLFESFNMILLAIVAPLSFIGLCCPCLFLWLDKRNYEDLEMDRFNKINDEVID